MENVVIRFFVRGAVLPIKAMEIQVIEIQRDGFKIFLWDEKGLRIALKDPTSFWPTLTGEIRKAIGRGEAAGKPTPPAPPGARECPFGRRFCDRSQKMFPDLDPFFFSFLPRQVPGGDGREVGIRAACHPGYLLRGTVYRPAEEGGGGVEGAEVTFGYGYRNPDEHLWDNKRLTALTDRQGRYEICAWEEGFETCPPEKMKLKDLIIM